MALTTGRGIAAAAALALLAACGQGGDTELPGNAQDDQPFAGIGEDEVLRLNGTEPFWSAEIDGTRLTYSTPENMDGTTTQVERFAGRGGLSYSGTLDGRQLDMTVTPGKCDNGMSPQVYPYTVTLQLGDDMRTGCGESDANPAAERPSEPPQDG